MADSVAQIRTDIYAVLTALDAAENIGLVHQYERWALHWGDVLTLLRDPTDGVARSWMIVYQGYSPEPLGGVYPQYEGVYKSLTVRAHRFLVRGVLALDDAASSEITFASTTEDICNALDADENLHSAVRYWGEPPTEPVNLDTFEIRSFAGVLCHVAEIGILVRALHKGG